ncbi:hypothetical protein Egran_00085 [Elaphomyces granulatus]|uniref:Uncharacterized protein n=1 Tax=Elaphomyces granulatus TaxID=519963 RepID=A0A232M723_9EURO|nr:hypothetical protein Egran_00085 [Elaphomyces granulatus]
MSNQTEVVFNITSNKISYEQTNDRHTVGGKKGPDINY